LVDRFSTLLNEFHCDKHGAYISLCLVSRIDVDQLFILQIILYFTFIEHAFMDFITTNSMSRCATFCYFLFSKKCNKNSWCRRGFL